ncbi:hypothetical protein V8C86DRAFT_1201746 [Haematococcus lacustris]
MVEGESECEGSRGSGEEMATGEGGEGEVSRQQDARAGSGSQSGQAGNRSLERTPSPRMQQQDVRAPSQQQQQPHGRPGEQQEQGSGTDRTPEVEPQPGGLHPSVQQQQQQRTQPGSSYPPGLLSLQSPAPDSLQQQLQQVADKLQAAIQQQAVGAAEERADSPPGSDVDMQGGGGSAPLEAGSAAGGSGSGQEGEGAGRGATASASDDVTGGGEEPLTTAAGEGVEEAVQGSPLPACPPLTSGGGSGEVGPGATPFAMEVEDGSAQMDAAAKALLGLSSVLPGAAGAAPGCKPGADQAASPLPAWAGQWAGGVGGRAEGAAGGASRAPLRAQAMRANAVGAPGAPIPRVLQELAALAQDKESQRAAAASAAALAHRGFSLPPPMTASSLPGHLTTLPTHPDALMQGLSLPAALAATPLNCELPHLAPLKLSGVGSVGGELGQGQGHCGWLPRLDPSTAAGGPGGGRGLGPMHWENTGCSPSPARLVSTHQQPNSFVAPGASHVGSALGFGSLAWGNPLLPHPSAYPHSPYHPYTHHLHSHPHPHHHLLHNQSGSDGAGTGTVTGSNTGESGCDGVTGGSGAGSNEHGRQRGLLGHSSRSAFSALTVILPRSQRPPESAVAAEGKAGAGAGAAGAGFSSLALGVSQQQQQQGVQQQQQQQGGLLGQPGLVGLGWAPHPPPHGPQGGVLPAHGSGPAAARSHSGKSEAADQAGQGPTPATPVTLQPPPSGQEAAQAHNVADTAAANGTTGEGQAPAPTSTLPPSAAAAAAAGDNLPPSTTAAGNPAGQTMATGAATLTQLPLPSHRPVGPPPGSYPLAAPPGQLLPDSVTQLLFALVHAHPHWQHHHRHLCLLTWTRQGAWV